VHHIGELVKHVAGIAVKRIRSAGGDGERRRFVRGVECIGKGFVYHRLVASGIHTGTVRSSGRLFIYFKQGVVVHIAEIEVVHTRVIETNGCVGVAGGKPEQAAVYTQRIAGGCTTLRGIQLYMHAVSRQAVAGNETIPMDFDIDAAAGRRAIVKPFTNARNEQQQ
jgi:hypothetical protein